MNDKCDSFIELINDYLDKNLDAKRQRELNEHLDACKECTQELKDLEATLNSIQTLKNLEIPAAKENFAREIIQKLESEKPKSTIIRFSSLKYVAASLLAAIIAGFIGIHFWPKNTTPVATNNTEHAVAVEFSNDFDYIIYENDNSVLADAGFPTDEWGLLDIDGL